MGAVVDFKTIPELFHNLVERSQGKNETVLRYKDKKSKKWIDIGFDELEDQVRSFASFLYARGIRKGDRVAILSENRPEWMIADLATHEIGGVNVSLYTSLPTAQAAYIIQDSGAKLFIVSSGIQLKKAVEMFDDCPEVNLVVTMSEMRKEYPDYVVSWDDAMAEGAAKADELADKIGELRAAVDENDVCVLIYTSGTTGNPKGVMLTHKNFCSNAKSALGVVPFGPGDHHLSFLPLCHSFERTAGYLAVLAAGAKISFAESIDTVNRNLLEVKPTVMISVPRLFERIYNTIAKSVKEGPAVKQFLFEWSVTSGRKAALARRNGGLERHPVLRLRSAIAHRLVFEKLHEKLGGNLRFAVSGGAALPKDIGEFFEAAGIVIIEGYGLTETSPVLSVSPNNAPMFGRVGHIIPGVTVAIQRLSDGSIVGSLSGEDYPSSLTTEEGEIVAKGPNIMKGYWNDEESTRQAIDPDGWYHTGDVGRFVDGYLQITDRIKHMIVSKGGKNIYPGPIEDSFKVLAAVDQIMVVGEGREYLTALVVPDMEALAQFAKEKGIAHASDDDLIKSNEVQAMFKKTFRDYSKSVAAHEKIRDFRVILDPFSVENGLLTPTLKPRRRQISNHYEELIDGMYAGIV